MVSLRIFYSQGGACFVSIIFVCAKSGQRRTQDFTMEGVSRLFCCYSCCNSGCLWGRPSSSCNLVMSHFIDTNIINMHYNMRRLTTVF